MNRHEKMFEVGRKQLETEVNIVEIIKLSRYFKAALQTLLTNEQRLQLKQRTRYVKVSQKDLDQLLSDKDKTKKSDLVSSPKQVDTSSVQLVQPNLSSSIHRRRLGFLDHIKIIQEKAKQLDSDMTSGFESSSCMSHENPNNDENWTDHLPKACLTNRMEQPTHSISGTSIS